MNLMLLSSHRARASAASRLAVAGALLSVAGPSVAALGAQQSPVSAGLAGAGGALPVSSGVSSNPAMLGLSGTPRVSIALPSLDAGLGLEPVGFTAFTPFSGELIPASVRNAWLDP